MKEAVVDLLVCPRCHRSLLLTVRSRSSGEIIDGSFACPQCGSTFPIVAGIPRFLPGSLTQDQKDTADAFGYEWTRYSTITAEDRREFLDWIAPLTPKDFENRTVLDGGCGKGRHALLAAQFNARSVIGIDLSAAVEAAYRNTVHLPNVHILQADMSFLPFAQPFDLAYSIGVLHHLPVPKDGFIALASHVKPGGRIATWVYGKEGNQWIETFVDPVRKNITSRLPRVVTRFLCVPPAIFLYAGLKLLYRPATRIAWLKKVLPYSDYLCSISNYSFAENFWNVFDQLVAPTAFYHRREEVEDWYNTIHGDRIIISRHNENSWRATALLPDRIPSAVMKG
ncbi:MAG: methyltransferase domain-containing protein [Acidobacteriaceae bacterium]